MVEFKFRVRAPVVTWWQWVRHRTFNFNAQSGRYTPFEENDFYVVPPDVAPASPSNKQASEGLVEDAAWLTDALVNHYEEGFRLYQAALEAGVAREQARLFLAGFSVYYTWVAKIDAHNLMHFLRLRMANDAQYEIRRVRPGNLQALLQASAALDGRGVREVRAWPSRSRSGRRLTWLDRSYRS